MGFTNRRIIEEELTAFFKAESYSRTDKRTGYRNGYKPRTFKTRVGRIELMVPDDFEGRFQTELFEKYRRNLNMNCGETSAIITTDILVS